ncbi:MAG: DUF937 domain-containing protein [Chlorobiota bacterium]|jgi:hypothetical protein|nr:DUF937 domain-containing protein [Chlorobiota bacterium]QQS67041.1 MAG: DUF937 domain-containing protein [Chlorobiota bacterium]
MSLFENVSQLLSGPALQLISSQLGADQGKTQSAIQGALPLIISALSKNSSTPEGANSLVNALDRDHDGSVVNDIAGFIGGVMEGTNAANGAGILQHLLGDKQQLAQQGVAQSSGLDMGQAAQLLTTLAPIVMSYLGQNKQQAGLDANNISGFLGDQQQQAQQSTPGILGTLSNLVDMNHDGSPIDDVLGFIGNFMKK